MERLFNHFFYCVFVEYVLQSTLLNAILGEVALTRGSIEYEGSCGFANQQNWIFGETIRENIIFGMQFESEKYHRILDACALQQDLKSLPENDLTLVGDSGITLSGGQRARVTLAR